MEFVKQHKTAFLIGSCILVLGLILFFGIKNLFYSGNSNKFGNRLEGIEEVKIEDNTFQQIAADIKKNTSVNTVTYHTVGKRINFTIDVKKDTALDSAKSLTNSITEKLSEEQKKYFDIHVLLTQSESEESELYPAMGYRSKGSNAFSWSNKNIGGKNET